MNLRIRRGDVVFVTTGKDKGKTGVVKKVVREKSKVIVEGINMVNCYNKRKHKGVAKKEMPLHVSNVAHIDPTTSKPTKVRVLIEEGVKYLVSKSSGSKIRKVTGVNYG